MQGVVGELGHNGPTSGVARAKVPRACPVREATTDVPIARTGSPSRATDHSDLNSDTSAETVALASPNSMRVFGL